MGVGIGILHAGPDPAPKAKATFECVGLAWAPAGGAAANKCDVRYRVAGAQNWKDAQGLWFDGRNAEYRGSIVGLTPGSRYEIELRLSNGAARSLAVATWAETFPVGSTVLLPASSNQTLAITESGTSQAYTVYQPHPQQSAAIDVKGKAAACITVSGSYVIVRGVTCRNARQNAIELLAGAHDVVIEYCDISGWGHPAADGWGTKDQSGIFSDKPSIHNIVIQRNRIHHPATDSNNWEEDRPLYKNGAHPNGPQGISFFKNNKGNNVIRYNEIYSDFSHMFNDGIGGGDNFGTAGFPGAESDVYGNIVSHCWDNPLEIEGGGKNVRVWGNYTDNSYTGIATVSCSVGPLYIFRNIHNKSLRSPDPGKGNLRFLKAGSATYKGAYWGDGRVYFYHNTTLQERLPAGGFGGVKDGLDGSAGVLTNCVSRNNIWFTRLPTGIAINDNNPGLDAARVNDWDYDLFNGRMVTRLPFAETHGVRNTPVFAPDNGNMFNPFEGKLKTALKPASPGFDAGVRLVNFNDDFEGAAPDMGACEGGTWMQFGVRASRLNGR